MRSCGSGCTDPLTTSKFKEKDLKMNRAQGRNFRMSPLSIKSKCQGDGTFGGLVERKKREAKTGINVSVKTKSQNQKAH